MNRRSRSRGGALLIAVLVCMGVAITILLGGVQLSLHQRRQMKLDLQMEQTRWLLDAAIDRALDQFHSDPDYGGESISVAPTLEKYGAATIRISLERSGEPTDPVEVLVTARLRGTGLQPAWTQRSKELHVEIEHHNQN